MKDAMFALTSSIIRTIVPAIVASVFGLLITTGVFIDSEFKEAFTLVLTLVLFTLYYIGVRLLETFVWPKFGWLLGLARTPVKYTAESPMEGATDPNYNIQKVPL